MSEDELALGLDQLTPRELMAFKSAVQMKAPFVSPSTSNGFFQLFLAGRTCLEIAEMNKGFTLGQIVRCRVEGEWDRRLKEHLEQLMRDTLNQVTQVKLESLRYQSDLIRVHHRLYGERIAKFLQTGNPDELAGVPLPTYKVLVQQLAELTENKDQKVTVIDARESKVVEGTAKRVDQDIFASLAQKVKKGE